MSDRYNVILRLNPRLALPTLLFLAALAAAMPARASVVDARSAEATYQSGEYKEARAQFEKLVEDFRNTNTDTSDYKVYREAVYLYDRLADCAFTQQDWDSMKRYLDGMLVVSHSERSMSEAALSGALASGIAYASAGYLSERLDESVRISSIVQLKRSLVLVLVDSRGSGEAGRLAIEQYQQLALLMRDVVDIADGYYALDLKQLEKHYEDFDAVFARLDEIGNVEELWDRYPPAGHKEAEAGESPPAG